MPLKTFFIFFANNFLIWASSLISILADAEGS